MRRSCGSRSWAGGSRRTSAASGLRGDPKEVPFDQTNADEFRMRSAIEFPGSFKCPVRIYYGADEAYTEGLVELARRAHALGRDVEAVRVPGDHDTMKAAALPLAIELFRAPRGR
jgi:hypothetical protein